MTAFRDGAENSGHAVALSNLFGDATLWCAVLQWAAASRPCPLSHGGGVMIVAAVSQDESRLG